MNILNGFRIVVCGSYETKVKRTWKERLFTLPFRPLQVFKSTITPMLPDGQIVVSKEYKIITCNEKTSIELAKKLEHLL